MDAIKAIETKKSVRSYSTKPVEDDKVQTIVKATGSAPKAGEFHISVISNKDILKEINDKALYAMKKSGNDFLMSRAAIEGYAPLYGAPIMIVISTPEGVYGPATAACAATNATIAASALELGSCYLVSPNLAFGSDKELCKKIGVPEGYEAKCGVIVGYAEGDAFATPKDAQKNNVNYVK